MGPQTTLRPIVRPDSPRWLTWAAPPGGPLWAMTSQQAKAVFAVVFFAVAMAAMINVVAGAVMGALGVAALFGQAVAALVLSKDHLVCGPAWQHRGRSIEGEAFKMLEDIDARFAYAEQQIGRVPTGIDWT